MSCAPKGAANGFSPVFFGDTRHRATPKEGPRRISNCQYADLAASRSLAACIISRMDLRWLQYQWNVNRALERRQVIPATIDPDYIKHCYNTGTSPIVCAMNAHNHLRPLRINGVIVNPGLCPRCQSPHVMVEVIGGNTSGSSNGLLLWVGAVGCLAPCLILGLVLLSPLILGGVAVAVIVWAIVGSNQKQQPQRDTGVRTCLQCGHKWRAF